MNTNELNTNVSNNESELSNTTVQPTDQDAMMQQIEDTFTRIRRGQIVPGEILYVTDNQIMVNINFRSDGIINRDEMPEDIEDPREHFKAGDQIDVYVVKVDDGEGNVVLSLRRIKDAKAWDDLEAKFEAKEHLNVLIKEEVNKGLVADYEGARLFMPASHAYDRFRKNLSGLVGQTVEVELIDFDKSRRRAIVSRREIERERIQKEKDEFWSQIEVGQVRTGKVARLTNFGAFIELGPVDGLIHISDMSWGRIRSPKELLNVSDEIEVKVLDIDQEKERVSLGIKQLKEDPWVTFTSNYKVGDTIKGTVVSMPDFGAFVNVGDGIDGLVHISQICVEHIEKPSDVLNIGQEVEAKIVDIKDEDKKVSLSMRALVEPEKPQRERRPRKERVKEEAPKEEKVETNPIDNPLFDSEVLGELKKMAQAESDDTEE